MHLTLVDEKAQFTIQSNFPSKKQNRLQVFARRENFHQYFYYIKCYPFLTHDLYFKYDNKYSYKLPFEVLYLHIN